MKIYEWLYEWSSVALARVIGFLSALDWSIILFVGFCVGIVFIVIDKVYEHRYEVGKGKAEKEHEFLCFPGIFLKNKYRGPFFIDIGKFLTISCAIIFVLGYVYCYVLPLRADSSADSQRKERYETMSEASQASIMEQMEIELNRDGYLSDETISDIASHNRSVDYCISNGLEIFDNTEAYEEWKNEMILYYINLE